ncbi:MAG: hypothetical protein AAGC56_01970 [Pseudomonadota bacterium]
MVRIIVCLAVATVAAAGLLKVNADGPADYLAQELPPAPSVAAAPEEEAGA